MMKPDTGETQASRPCLLLSSQTGVGGDIYLDTNGICISFLLISNLQPSPQPFLGDKRHFIKFPIHDEVIYPHISNYLWTPIVSLIGITVICASWVRRRHGPVVTGSDPASGIVREDSLTTTLWKPWRSMA